ncbi:hypothetical protein [Streptomyces axinellae]
MLYHTLQLMTCAAVARRWAGRAVTEDDQRPESSLAPAATGSS